MLIDRIENWRLYRGLDPRWVRALQFLHETDVNQLPLGRLDLDGDHLYALIQEYSTRPEADCRWEAHRRYCDVQFVARGAERMGVSHLSRVQTAEAYDAERDVEFFRGDGDFVTLTAGCFAIFAPHDVHKPCVSIEGPETVRKLVFKAQCSTP